MNNVKLDTKQKKTNDTSAYQYQRFGKKHGPEKMILCDTNIFIEAFKNNPSATETLRCIGFQNIELLTYNVKDFQFIQGIKLFFDS